MDIVSTGVHATVGGCKGKSRLFLDGQSVTIGSNSQNRTRLVSLEKGGYSMPSDSLPNRRGRKSHPLKSLYNVSLRLGGLETKFRIGMNMAPPLYDLRQNCFRFVLDVCHDTVFSFPKVFNVEYSIVRIKKRQAV
ncbi:hypothetical protein SDC9_139958 [bioreactor metagenome]|jgi:hypothetical protein|uniref:Uncharacterized protein n=1 Tax=bioreactor metagenome TaxID=1076179 RepID=A0A645DWW0_9ZZZZ